MTNLQIIRKRAKLRKYHKKLIKLLWTTSISSRKYDIYKKRLKETRDELTEINPLANKAIFNALKADR